MSRRLTPQKLTKFHHSNFAGVKSPQLKTQSQEVSYKIGSRNQQIGVEPSDQKKVNNQRRRTNIKLMDFVVS